MDTLLFAEHFCMQEQKLYAKIRPQECMIWAKSQLSSNAKHLAAFNAFEDKISAWVKLSILSNEGLGKRSETVDLWIKVAEVSIYPRAHHPLHP